MYCPIAHSPMRYDDQKNTRIVKNDLAPLVLLTMLITGGEIWFVGNSNRWRLLFILALVPDEAIIGSDYHIDC